MNDIEEYILQQRELINKAIKTNLEEDFSPEYVHHQAAADILFPARRYRSILSLELYKMLEGEQLKFLEGVVGLEFIHHASLIFDDLPCMDNPPTRKGKIPTHEKFGKHHAILGALFLHTQGRDLILKTEYNYHNPSKEIGGLMYEVESVMNEKIKKMLIGQEVDLRKEKSDEELLDSMCKKNLTFYLASVLPSYLLEKEEYLLYMKNIGKSISLGYQFFDDLRDEEGDPKITGKGVGIDHDNSVKRWGVPAVKEMLFKEMKKIIRNLRKIQKNSRLEEITEYVLTKPS